jgi:hypothetical protein
MHGHMNVRLVQIAFITVIFDCLEDMETLEFFFFVLSRKPVLTFYDYIVLEYVPVLTFGRMLLEIFRKV